MNELPSVINTDDCPEAAHKVNDDSNLFTPNCGMCGQIPTYADDSTVVISSTTRLHAQEKIVEITDKMKIFLSSNSLSLNLSKTEIVEIMVRQKRAKMAGSAPQLTVMKPDSTLKVITAKDYCRLLGGNLNKNATWSHHLYLGEKPVVKSLRTTLGFLTHIASNLPVSSRLLLANGLFLSKLIYLLPMWGGS